MEIRQQTKFIIGALISIVVFCGCAGPVQKTGFLSDYSKLEAVSETKMRYVNLEKAKNYKNFIIEPVAVHFHSKSEAPKKLKKEQIQELTQYMHAAMIKALGDAYGIESVPGPGVMRIRAAITDLKKTEPALNILPTSKIAGLGLGGASLEAEFLDSQTGEQIAAVIESQVGNRLSLAGYSEWGDAKEIMDGWAKRFRERLDEIHGISK